MKRHLPEYSRQARKSPESRRARRNWTAMGRTGLSIGVTKSMLVAGLVVLAPVALAPVALANESLSSANIFLDIRTDNAAIDTLTSFGFDNFNPGTPVSDWGLMLDGASSTFQLNTTSGGGIAFGTLTNSGGVISGTATYASGAYALTLTREYQLVGPNSVMVTTIVQNDGQAIGSFLGFDTFDPDIGIPRAGGFPTYNDVFTSGGVLIGLASDNVTSRYSVALGATDPRAVVAAGNPFQINSATLLTSVATAPFDGNGALADQGLHIVFSTPLAAGATTTFQYFLNFGTSPADAITALEATMGGFCPTDNLSNTCLVTPTTDQNVVINAQGGTDALQLGGTTNFDFNIARIDTRYTNFEIFQKVDTSTVTLTGTTSLASLGFEVSGGTLVAGSGQLGATGANDILTPGILHVTSDLTTGSIAGNGSVILDGTLTTGGNNLPTTFSGALSGPGGLTKEGAGAFTLSGTNTFAGAINVNNGTLVANNAAGHALGGTSELTIASFGTVQVNFGETVGKILGNGALVLNAGLTVNDNASYQFDGDISGAGKLSKDGSGMLFLGGVNTFSGGIDILHGGIRLLNSNAAGTGPITTFGSVISYANAVNNAGPIIVNSNTTQLEVLAADVAQQSGVISEIGGSRPIEKIGTGTLTLSGANTYTGATTITAGTLIAQGGSAIFDNAGVTTASAGTFVLNTSETIGSFAGSGSLAVGSGSVLTTGGDNSSTSFSGSSSGAGGLVKTGSGVFQLAGANAFSGLLNVAAGNLTVVSGGSLSNMSAFNVLSGAQAFLGGTVQGVNGSGMTGTSLGAMSVSSSGTAYLDDNTALSVAAANLASGSNLNLFLTTNTSQYGQINASGTVGISGANVGVYLDPLTFSGTLLTTFTYNNVLTGSSVIGTFGSVNLLQSPSPLFSVTGIYSATSAGVQVTRNAFSTIGGNGNNQGNVGDGLENIFTNGTTDPDLLNLFSVLGSSPAGAIPIIYASIAGSENSENAGAALRSDDPWKQSVAERVNAARTTGCSVAGESWCLRRYAQASTNGGEVMSDVLGDPTAFDWLETGIRDEGSTSFWGRAIGAWGETKGDVEGPGSKQWTGGMIGGVDRVFDSLLLAGVALQYVETSVNFDASRNDSHIQSGQIGAYVSYGGAEAYVNGNVSVIGTQSKANRYFSIGLLDYDVSSTAESWALTASVEGGTIMEFDGLRFEPSLALNFQSAHPLDFDERGGGGLSLLVRPDDSSSLRSILSARLSRVYDLGDRKLVPQLRVDWRHEMLDRRQEFSAAFAGDPSVSFDVVGASYARDTFSAGASVTMPISGRVTGYIDAQGALSEDSVSALVSLGARATW